MVDRYNGADDQVLLDGSYISVEARLCELSFTPPAISTLPSARSTASCCPFLVPKKWPPGSNAGWPRPCLRGCSLRIRLDLPPIALLPAAYLQLMYDD